jgi:2-methylcitrate dehydratase PrpD
MPDINLQYLFAVALLDGNVSFAAAHDVERMNEPAIRALRSRVKLIGDPSFVEGGHAARVEIALKGGKKIVREIESFRGKADNPMSTAEVEDKARDLIEPVMGAGKTRKLIEAVRDLEHLKKARDLRPLLSSASAS